MLKRFSGTSPNIGVRAADLRVIKNKIPQLASALNTGFDAGKFYSAARIKALKPIGSAVSFFKIHHQIQMILRPDCQHSLETGS
ncbi:hypothetical protein [Pseudomonas protegens]|uniref:hypothetical protein n=1 Tax=Pseudomonas protegens TaxID=380021 RepID=UPI0011CDFED5|nr:hypothetical protein [Pseudomonas protegens]